MRLFRDNQKPSCHTEGRPNEEGPRRAVRHNRVEYSTQATDIQQSMPPIFVRLVSAGKRGAKSCGARTQWRELTV